MIFWAWEWVLFISPLVRSTQSTIPPIFKPNSCVDILVAKWLLACKSSFWQMTMNQKVAGLLKLNVHPVVIQILLPTQVEILLRS